MGFFLRRTLCLFLLLNALDFLIFLIGKALPVDIDLAGFGRSLRRADNAFQILKALKLQLVQLEQLVVVKIDVVKSVLNGSFGIDALQLLQELVGVILLHLCAADRNNRAVIEKFAHDDLVGLRGLSRFGGEGRGFRHHFECAVRRKVKHIAGLLYLPVLFAWRLNAEDGLQIA